MEVISRWEAKRLGERFYFSGVACKHGHLSERLVSSGVCRVCKVISSREERKADPGTWSRRRQRDPEKYRAYRRNYYHTKNKENHLRVAKATRNPLTHRCGEARRRARKRGNGGLCSREEALEILRLQKYKCACGCGTKLGKEGQHGHLDHIVPVIRGGSSDRRNLQWLAKPCNCSKHARDPVQWRQSLGYLL